MMNFQGFLDCFSNAHDGDVHINFISAPLRTCMTWFPSMIFLTAASQVLVAQIYFSPTAIVQHLIERDDYK